MKSLKIKAIMISIIIEDNGEISLKTTNGTIETEVASTIVVEAMRNLFPQGKDNKKPVRTTYYLYLNKVENNNKLSTARELSAQLHISLENAKVIMDSSVEGKEVMLSQSFDESYINNMKEALESVGCICEITKG